MKNLKWTAGFAAAFPGYDVSSVAKEIAARMKDKLSTTRMQIFPENEMISITASRRGRNVTLGLRHEMPGYEWAWQKHEDTLGDESTMQIGRRVTIGAASVISDVPIVGFRPDEKGKTVPFRLDLEGN